MYRICRRGACHCNLASAGQVVNMVLRKLAVVFVATFLAHACMTNVSYARSRGLLECGTKCVPLLVSWQNPWHCLQDLALGGDVCTCKIEAADALMLRSRTLTLLTPLRPLGML
jgi:hypothetical protein